MFPYKISVKCNLNSYSEALDRVAKKLREEENGREAQDRKSVGAVVEKYINKSSEASAKEIFRLRMGLERITKCAGAPDPTDGLSTAINIAKKTLDEEKSENMIQGERIRL